MTLVPQDDVKPRRDLNCSRRSFLAASLFLGSAFWTGLPSVGAASSPSQTGSRRLVLHGMIERASVLYEAELDALPWRPLSMPREIALLGLVALPLEDLLTGRGISSDARSLLVIGEGGARSLSLPLEEARATAFLLDTGATGLFLVAGQTTALAAVERIEIGRFIWSQPCPTTHLQS